MPRLESIWDKQSRPLMLLVSGVAIAATALVDWWTKPYVSLGFLYLFPVMLMAGFLPRWLVVLAGAGCAYLSDAFSSLPPEGEYIRLSFETLAIAGCGLFVNELARNRRLTSEAQEK